MVMATIDLMPLTSDLSEIRRLLTSDLSDAINPIVYMSKTMTVSSLRALKPPPCMSLHANAILFISIDEANQAVRQWEMKPPPIRAHFEILLHTNTHHPFLFATTIQFCFPDIRKALHPDPII
uniref:Uncharacterized protein n=1 Tax=Gossypium raimondii TaxID=29730 RepID=A0A0D2RP79_GOSRA|nr:hypothetical protein B456_006G024000 [Gossypium raimondii]KJB33649.1 hypothetical protein B456_006G024000 [Gossypium raimondii]